LIAAVCFCVALCSVCASCVQGSHLRGPALQAIGLEHQGQGPLQMVRRVVLAVQQPRGYSVRTLPTTPMSHLIVPLVLAVLAGSGPCCVWVCVL
jgi:hypothetical protein